MSGIENARALLALFARSEWQDLHVRTAGQEIFLAKPGSGPNPMRAAAAGAAAAVRAEPEIVPAPHVATLLELRPAGSRVAAGDTVATIALLDERIELPSPVAGIVAEGLAAPGDLVDYGAPLIAVTPA